MPNLIPYSSLYWNPGSPTCLAQCYSQRHKQAYSQGQPRPLLKFLKSENLNITPPTTVKVSLHLTERYKSHTYIQVFWCHLYKGEKKRSGKCLPLLTGWSKEKSRVLCRAFSWSFSNWINNWTVQDVSGEDTDPMAQMTLTAPLEALPCVCSLTPCYQAKLSRAAWTHCLCQKVGPLTFLAILPEGKAFTKHSSELMYPRSSTHGFQVGHHTRQNQFK